METTLKELSRNARIRINGSAVGERQKMDEWQRDRAYNGKSYNVTLFYKGRRMTVNFFDSMDATEEPTAEQLLECLLSDVVGNGYGAETFEEFAADFGYDEDSRKAEAIFRTCQAQTRKLKNMLGEDFDRFMQAERD